MAEHYMRKNLVVFIALVLLLSGAFYISRLDDAKVADHQVEGEPAAQYVELGGPDDVKLLPVDEASMNADFERFWNELLTAAKQKDLTFIKEHTHENIRYTFGPNDGVDGFLREWKLDANPDESPFWDELSEVLELGGVFDGSGKSSFTAPYIYARFPENIDPFQHAAVTDQQVKVYAEPNSKSTILGTLSYSIVRLDPGTVLFAETGSAPSWVKIRTFSGDSGFIQAKHVRSPIDYRARWQNINGTWKMVFFVAGD